MAAKALEGFYRMFKLICRSTRSTFVEKAKKTAKAKKPVKATKGQRPKSQQR